VSAGRRRTASTLHSDLSRRGVLQHAASGSLEFEFGRVSGSNGSMARRGVFP
jgi:hypothetical protein